MKKIIVLIITVIAYCVPALASEYIDVVYVNDSTKKEGYYLIEGYILSQETGKTMVIKKLNGELLTLEMSKVMKTVKMDKDYVNIYDIDYSEFGVNLGTPGIFNVLIGRWFSPFGISLSGMHWGSIYGIQGNLRFKLSDNFSRCHSIALLAGHSHWELETQDRDSYYTIKKDEIYEWNYFGLAYNMNWGGFWLEGGMSVGHGDFPSPQIIFQIGYVHRFID